MLTDRAKTHFESWAYLNDFRFAMNLKPLFKNTVIIEWLESVGLLIEIGIDQTSAPKFDYKILKYEHFGNYEYAFVDLGSDGLYRSQQEAIEQAIVKANEIYNQ